MQDYGQCDSGGNSQGCFKDLQYKKKLILLKRQSNVPQQKLQCEERGHVMPDTVTLYGLLQSLSALYLQTVTIAHTATNAGAIQVH